MLRSTRNHKKYWEKRKIDWKTAYFDTWNHPHRKLIIDKLRKIKFNSLLELGCASGPNLWVISKIFPKVTVGGIDLNVDAIEMAKRFIPKGELHVGSADDIFFNDKSCDVILTDMTLIYVGGGTIGNVIDEIKRVGRSHVIFCEFHHKSFWKRFGLKLAGYYAYDYRKLLKNSGFYDIEIDKIKEEDWPGGDPQKTFGYIITAKL